MNYNKYSYYRSNPYHNQGNMPPIAQLNRKPRDFIGQIPMGEHHLQPIGRKQFVSLHHRSSIQQQNILSSPEKYPFENRIAMDKGYLRNLNTIDIEGAKSGTVVSQAVKNRMKAQLELQRQRKERNNQVQSKIQNYMRLQEQQKRQIAQRQYQKNKELQGLITSSNNALRRNNNQKVNQTIDAQYSVNDREAGNKPVILNRNRDFDDKGYIKHNYHNYQNPQASASQGRKAQGQLTDAIENIYEKQKYTFVNPLKQMQKERTDRYSEKVNQIKQLKRQNSNSQTQTDQLATNLDSPIDHHRRIQYELSGGDNSPLFPGYKPKRSSDLRKDNPTNLSSLNQSFGLAGRNSFSNY